MNLAMTKDDLRLLRAVRKASALKDEAFYNAKTFLVLMPDDEKKILTFTLAWSSIYRQVCAFPCDWHNGNNNYEDTSLFMYLDTSTQDYVLTKLRLNIGVRVVIFPLIENSGDIFSIEESLFYLEQGMRH
jgi:hypothetical protein